jgi:opacity protein-like surface antigen
MRLKAISVAVALGLSSFAAQAADNGGKFYVLASVGMAKYDLGETEDYYNQSAADYLVMGADTSMADIDDSGVTFSVGGGFQFNQYVAAEVFYRSYGEAAAGVHAAGGGDFVNEQDSLKASGLGVGVVGGWPLTPELSIFGRLDAVSLKAEDEYSYNDSLGNPSENSSIDDTNLKIGFGLGAQYDFGSGFAVRGEYQRIEAEIDNGVYSGKADIDSLSVSLLKAF